MNILVEVLAMDGKIVDIAGNKLNIGGPYVQTVTPYTAGGGGYAYSIRLDRNGIIIPGDSKFSVKTSSSYTFSSWFNISDTLDISSPLTTYNSCTDWYAIFRNWNGYYGLYLEECGSNTVLNDRTIFDSKWHFISVCKDNNTIYIGMDGKVTSTPYLGTGSYSNQDLIVGYTNYDAAGVRGMWGNLQDVFLGTGEALFTANYTPPQFPVGLMKC